MSTAAYRSTHSSRSFTRQQIRTSSTNAILPTMTNDHTRFRSQTSNIPPPVPRVGVSLSTNSTASPNTSFPFAVTPSPLSSKFSNDNSTSKICKQPYTFSNPPREIQRQSMQNMKYLRNTRLRQRVSSAPDENSSQNSPRSVINQQKPSSANDSSTPRSHDDNRIPQLPTNSVLKRDEQQKSSLNALMKEQERSKVPKAVQQRRIILLFRRLPPSTSPLISPRQEQDSSSIKSDIMSNDIHLKNKRSNNEVQHLTNNTSKKYLFIFKDFKLSWLIYFKAFSSSDPPNNDPFHGFDQAETADSKQIAAILANLQSSDEWIPNTTNSDASPRCQEKSFDPAKYEYVAKNSFDTTTFKLSPRTLKPDEDLAARSRFSQNYRYEMLSSANAQIPPLMASIVAENNNTIGTGTVSEKTFTFRLNSTTTRKKQSSLDDIEPIPSTMDGEQVQLCFDEILKCFYDPTTGTYYELTSA